MQLPRFQVSKNVEHEVIYKHNYSYSNYEYFAPVEAKRKYLIKIGETKIHRSRHSTNVELKKNVTNIFSRLMTPPNGTECSALYVKCSNSYYDRSNIEKIHSKHEMGENTPQDVILSPWNAYIYADGVYKCTGILIGLEWVITSKECVKDVQ